MNKKTLPKLTAKKIKDLIVDGEFKQGEQIPNEQILLERFEVSRPTLREAIKILVSQNILEIKRGRGTFVAMQPGLSDDPFGFEFMDQSSLLYNVAEIRLLLEPLACGLAASRATDEEIEKLLDLSNQIADIINQSLDKLTEEEYEKMTLLHMQFHTQLFQMSHNPVLDRMLPILSIAQYESFSNEGFVNNFRENYRGLSHRDICEAIQARDSKTAYNLRKEQLLQSAINSYEDKMDDIKSIFI